jgi:hypothetical protein
MMNSRKLLPYKHSKAEKYGSSCHPWRTDTDAVTATCLCNKHKQLLNINKVCKAFADTHINIAVRNRAEHINI